MRCRKSFTLDKFCFVSVCRGLLAALCVGGALYVPAQQTSPAPAPTAERDAAPLAFDAISVHPTRSGTIITGNVEVHRTTIRTLDDGYMAENISPKYLIATAYNVKQDSISGGPDWIDSVHYDINAKVSGSDSAAPPKLTGAQRRQMLQSLLADRFQLVVHTETKEAPIFELSVTKTGPKFHEATPGDTFASGVKGLDGLSHPGFPMMTGPGQLTGQGVTISSVIDVLSQTLHRPVVDKSGLTGEYDISLQWTPDSVAAADPANDDGSSIFTALREQLGLKLESTKGPVKTLVIDNVAKPSEN
jgi:uncharacterized protein (TIGR03435 family)